MGPKPFLLGHRLGAFAKCWGRSAPESSLPTVDRKTQNCGRRGWRAKRSLSWDREQGHVWWWALWARLPLFDVWSLKWQYWYKTWTSWPPSRCLLPLTTAPLRRGMSRSIYFCHVFIRVDRRWPRLVYLQNRLRPYWRKLFQLLKTSQIDVFKAALETSILRA